MEYVYTAMLLHSAGAKVDAKSVERVASLRRCECDAAGSRPHGGVGHSSPASQPLPSASRESTFWPKNHTPVGGSHNSQQLPNSCPRTCENRCRPGRPSFPSSKPLFEYLWLLGGKA